VTAPDPVLDRLRQAFAADGAIRTDCPDGDALWRLASGSAESALAARIADHLPRCPSCVVALRLAHELGESPRPRAGAATSMRRVAFTGIVVAVAASVLVWLGMRNVPPPHDEPTIYRGPTPGAEVLAPLDPDRAIAATDALLRWSPGPPGTRYDVYVSSENLDEIASAQELDVPEFRVPADALTASRGAVVLWSVEARLPDGTLIVSSTWTTRVE
jgi:hypothetical protein